MDILACLLFGPTDIPANGHFITVDVLAWGLFGMWTFRDKDFLPFLAWGHSGMETLAHWDMLAWIFQQSGCFGAGTNFVILFCMVPKSTCAEMSL